MTYHARVDQDGKLEVSSELLALIGLTPGALVSIANDRGKLVLEGADHEGALSRLRDAMSGYSVDQFLAERRADWGE